jgi:hypothetical protein
MAYNAQVSLMFKPISAWHSTSLVMVIIPAAGCFPVLFTVLPKWNSQILTDVGIAFRMAQDLGLQQDPKFWAREDSIINDEVELAIRRRVYWGCYIADKSAFPGPVYVLVSQSIGLSACIWVGRRFCVKRTPPLIPWIFHRKTEIDDTSMLITGFLEIIQILVLLPPAARRQT